MKDKLELLLLLSYVKGIGPKRMEFITTKVNSIMELKERFTEISQELDNQTVENLRKIMNNFCLEETILKYKEKNIKILIKEDPDYPMLLKEIYDPPLIIFCKGNVELLKNLNNIAIVGSRKGSFYGKKVAQEMGEFLSEHKFTITSGMASGIDAWAHKGALEGEGSSIGVLGCGLDIIYPRQNEKLYREMEEKGLLLSTFPLGTLPLPGNFPARNRIISGLAKGVVVVEAGFKSGSLITADFALSQGRDVFAVPGNIHSVLSAGTNKLLKDGAIVVTKYDDILAEYNVKYSYEQQRGDSDLTTVEKAIAKATMGQEFSVEYLVLSTGLEISQILSNLITLEINGLIKKVGFNTYQWVGKVDF
ncbi:DNA processing protein [Anaerobranca californiensis DSM 14826]|jgi:DNA processing protein|uniref:DNA processing protein n=1 Tax=Anaerobranca californiensis DSM 14826 TaxID=1120989 RepID=A0A1M6KK92_9FIRM|nr:DNA-processing protein DprA [Anaerobranca californiensis]SHJ59374.1 DNA processing protein [Anaerobranca californiensis DSM 14826]